MREENNKERGKSKLSSKDYKLIKEADSLTWSEWTWAMGLIEKAESQYTKDYIKRIATKLSKEEEYKMGGDSF